MDNSDKDIIKKDDLSGEKPKETEKHPEIEENDETCEEKELMCDKSISPQVKRKSESDFENKRKRSTDNVQKESDNLANYANMQGTDMAADNSIKYEEHQSPATLPCNKKKSTEKCSNQSTSENKIITSSEESNFVLKEIEALMTKYMSSAIHKSECERAKLLLLEKAIADISTCFMQGLKNVYSGVTDNQQNVTSDEILSENLIDSKDSKIGHSNKDDKKIIDENLLEQEQGDNEPSKFLKSARICTKCQQGDELLTPIISPGKRKSEERVEDEIKRKRSVNNAQIEVNSVKNLNDSLNVQDSTLHATLSKEGENNLVNTVVSNDETAEGCVKEQNIAEKADQSTIKDKITTGKTNNETHALQTLNNKSIPDQTQCSDKILLLEDSDGSSNSNIAISFVEDSFSSSLETLKKGEIINVPNEIKDESISEDRLSEPEIKDTETLSKVQDFPEISKSEILKKAEDEKVKFPSKMSITNTHASGDIPRHIRQPLDSTRTYEDSTISNSRGAYTKSLEPRPPYGIIGDHLYRRNSGWDLNPDYKDHESQVWDVELMEKDAEFVQSQHQLLESVKQSQQISSTQPESEDEENILKPIENRDPNEVSQEIPYIEYARVGILTVKLNNILKSQGHDIRFMDNPTLISRLTELAKILDPDIIPFIPCCIIRYRKHRRQSPEATNIAYDRSIKESLEETDRDENPTACVDGSPDKYLRIVNQLSPISSPPKNESDDDKISRTDLPKFREYPGLAENPTKVKKDARYQKKFYKQKKPVTLPVNWTGDRPSGREIEPDIESDENEKSVKNNQRYKKIGYKVKPIMFPANWSSDGDSEIEQNIGSDNNQIQETVDDQRIASKNSEDGMHEESEDQKNILKDKDMFKEKENSPQDKSSETSYCTSEYKICSFMEESPNSSQSNSPKINNESRLTSMLEAISQHEELSACSMSNASEISNSPAEPPQPPSSPAEPPQTNLC